MNTTTVTEAFQLPVLLDPPELKGSMAEDFLFPPQYADRKWSQRQWQEIETPGVDPIHYLTH